MLDLEMVLPEQALVDLICAHQGVVTEAELLAAGYTLSHIRQLCQEEQLIEIAPARYRLTTLWELTLIDQLVLVQWAIPEGIIGARTALSEHRITLYIPKKVDVCVPPGWSGEDPPGFHLHPFELPPELRMYGVQIITPECPGNVQVPVKMYSPAVAVAQTLAGSYDQETQEECVWLYRQYIGDEAALQEAAQRYHVELPVFQAA
jgi:hypothetical protein